MTQTRTRNNKTELKNLDSQKNTKLVETESEEGEEEGGIFHKTSTSFNKATFDEIVKIEKPDIKLLQIIEQKKFN